MDAQDSQKQPLEPEIPSPAESVKKAKKPGKNATRKQIRGSSLLMFGQFISVGLNFLSQVLIVRYLSQADYGAWTYALSVVAFFEGFSSLGLKRAVSRFVPIFHENEEYNKLFGTIFISFVSVIITGAIFVGAVWVSPEVISELVKGEGQPVAILLILIFMVPVDALDLMLLSLFASFASSKIIFTRKHLLGPGVKLLVVLLLIFFESDVFFLAYGYLTVNALMVVLYTAMLYFLLKSQNLMKHFRAAAMEYPVKTIFAFSIPLMTSDLVNVLMHASDTMLLGYFHDTVAVANYKVILPAARFNKLVMTSFALLFTPLAARLFAQNDFKGINELYWKTAVWLGVLSFPLFAITFALADPLTVFLYGERYAESGLYLQLIAVAYYFNIALGFNGLTLKVLGKVRYVVIINVIAVVINLILNLILIPAYGALGATAATAFSMIVHNILKQGGLKLASGISVFDLRYLSFYGELIAGVMLLYLIQLFVTHNLFVLLGLTAIVTIVILKLSQHQLQIEENFPELLKIPGIKHILNWNPFNRK
ncbi:MAG: oligosaccharide flippase family protein [Calditrichia bacterium]